jgi:hypothetical protein
MDVPKLESARARRTVAVLGSRWLAILVGLGGFVGCHAGERRLPALEEVHSAAGVLRFSQCHWRREAGAARSSDKAASVLLECEAEWSGGDLRFVNWIALDDSGRPVGKGLAGEGRWQPNQRRSIVFELSRKAADAAVRIACELD